MDIKIHTPDNNFEDSTAGELTKMAAPSADNVATRETEIPAPVPKETTKEPEGPIAALPSTKLTHLLGAAVLSIHLTNNIC